jgi:hypothetical protein
MGGYERPQFKEMKKIEYLDKKGNVVRTEWKEVKPKRKTSDMRRENVLSSQVSDRNSEV